MLGSASKGPPFKFLMSTRKLRSIETGLLPAVPQIAAQQGCHSELSCIIAFHRQSYLTNKCIRTIVATRRIFSKLPE